MTKTTRLKVPAEYIGQFRRALAAGAAERIGGLAESLATDVAKVPDQIAHGGPEDGPAADVRRTLDAIGEDTGLLDQLLAIDQGDTEIIEMTGETKALQAAAERMVRQMGEEVRGPLDFDPIQVEDARNRLAALTWALDTAEVLDEQAA